jgi:hypothetical protein
MKPIRQATKLVDTASRVVYGTVYVAVDVAVDGAVYVAVREKVPK